MALPYTYYENIWTAQAVTATATLQGAIARLCPTKVIEIITTGFSGTLDIQGRISPAATLDNVSYALLSQGSAQAGSAAQLTWTTDTARYRYIVAEPSMDMALVMTRSAGSITVSIAGYGQLGLQVSAVLAKLAANSGTDIGDVDVLSVIPGVGATNLGKAEDAAHASGDTGVMALAVTKATAAALGADGDYAPLEVDASGRLHTTLSNVQLDDTDKLAVSLYGKTTAAGDTALVVGSGGDLSVEPRSVAGTTGTVDALDTAYRSYATGGNVPLTQRVTPMVFNGTTFDRMRSVASSGAGLGVQLAGTLGEAITLAASAARTATAGTNGTDVTGLGWRKRYLILLDVTAAATEVDDTLDVYIDGLLGSTYLNIVHFTQVLGNGGAKKFFAVLDGGTPPATVTDVTTDAAVGVVRASMAGLTAMRVRWVIVDAGGAAASFTFSATGWAI